MKKRISRKRFRSGRSGVAAVEFALVVPVFFLFVFGIIEFGRVVMVQQVLVNASREGARRAVLESATSDSVVDSVTSYLQGSSIDVSDSGISITPDPSDVSANEDITVTISVPFSEVSWMPPFMYNGNLSASTTMRSEKIE